MSATRPRLALLSPLPPYPPLSGGTSHIYSVTRQLARFYRVHLDALCADASQVAWGPLAECCEQLHAFTRPARLPPGIAPPAVRQERSPELAAHLRRSWATQPADVVQLEFTTMAQYAPLARSSGALVVCSALNVAFVDQLRRARLQRGAVLAARRWLGALSLWLYELRALPQCDLVVTLSEADAQLLRRWLPRLRVEYVPSGVDLSERAPCFDPQAENEVLFVGNYSHPPNLEGALWLAQQVWPLVRRARPSARLTLAGRDPPAAICALAGPDVRVPGTLDDLQPCYARASLAVAPIFWGSGVRIKILDALAYGMPLVASPQAAEGIALEQGVSVLFAQQPAAFAAAIERLLGNQALRVRLGTAARQVVERDYDWQRIGARLAARYAALRAERQR